MPRVAGPLIGLNPPSPPSWDANRETGCGATPGVGVMPGMAPVSLRCCQNEVDCAWACSHTEPAATGGAVTGRGR